MAGENGIEKKSKTVSEVIREKQESECQISYG